jgi:hypothetical protein
MSSPGGIASVWLPFCRVCMQPELVLGEEEKKERFKVSLNRRNQDEPISEPIDTNASEASTSRTSERPGIVVSLPITIVGQDMVVLSTPSTSSVIMNTKQDIAEDENLTNDSIISVSSTENLSGNEMNVAERDVIGFNQKKSNVSEEETLINAYNHEFNISVLRKEYTTKNAKKKPSVANSDASASTSAGVVNRVSVIRLVTRNHGNDNKGNDNKNTSEINDEKLETRRSTKISTAEKEKLETETEISCPESQIIMKYIHKSLEEEDCM